VAVIGGSGLTGMRLTDRVPYFISGVAFPDLSVFGPEVLENGGAAATCAGFFGNDWGLDTNDLAWGND
jgi:hypothetical protein